MTKFSALAPGERFRYQDAVLTKLNPLLATEEHTGRQRMIPRSADVERLNDDGSATVEAAPGSPPWRAALDHFHGRAKAALALAAEGDRTGAEALLESARRQFERHLEV